MKRSRKISPVQIHDFVAMDGEVYEVVDSNPQATKYIREDGVIYAEIDWKVRLSSEVDGRVVYAWSTDFRRKTLAELVNEEQVFQRGYNDEDSTN